MLPCWWGSKRKAQACHDPPLDHRHAPSLAAALQWPSSTAIKHTALSIIQQPERNVGRWTHLSRGWGGVRSPVPCQHCLSPDLKWRADSSSLSKCHRAATEV